MSNIEDKLWEHLVEHHDADRAQLRTVTTSRARRRPVMVGIAATGLAAVGVAAVLVSSSGSDSTPASGLSASAHPAPAGAPVKFQETAYIVKRVKAKIADGSQSGLVSYGGLYGSGQERSDGSLVNLGGRYEDQYQYTAPDGSVSFRQTYYRNDGSPRLIVSNVLSPDGNDAGTIINTGKHTYSQTQTSGVSRLQGTTPGLASSASEVQQALQNGQVTELGTTTVNGTQAIALSVKFKEPTGATPSRVTLYVDAQTYQPLRTVMTISVPNDPNIAVENWVPATPENIARAKDGSIPAGYTKVSNHTAITGSGDTGNSGNTGAG